MNMKIVSRSSQGGGTRCCLFFGNADYSWEGKGGEGGAFSAIERTDAVPGALEAILEGKNVN